MLYVIFKIINSATRVEFSNLKYDIEKSKKSKFGKNVKDLVGDMSSNYTIIIDMVGLHEDYVCHLFRALLSGPNSTINCLLITLNINCAQSHIL